MKEYKNKLFITTLITACPMLIGFGIWKELPDMMPLFYTLKGAAGVWAPKFVPIVILPLVLASIHYLCIHFTMVNPEVENMNKTMLKVMFWILPVMSWVLCGNMYGNVIGGFFAGVNWIYIGVGVFFLLVGNYMANHVEDRNVGYRVSWALNSPENWRRTHLLASKLYTIAGMVCIADSFVSLGYATIICFLTAAIVPFIYSYTLHKRGI